ncbi:alpha/beta hydrolase family protein [Motilimonas cestriensis]|uniref:Alpha/beta hydrolase family protein n=1 Tax=Motilimonas cestriensis TaxID=2742685 RepID=A0ABS8W870_9GAMM|nr:DUF3530 family protein [Motilimonas cestriensis]MCE2595186.1 alpha/beta hydrolase family protein [Motilimonas cestriensis]
MLLKKFAPLLLTCLLFSAHSFAAEEVTSNQEQAPAESDLTTESTTELSTTETSSNEAASSDAESSTEKSNSTDPNNPLKKWPIPPSQDQLLGQDLTDLYLPEQTITLGQDPSFTVVVYHSENSPTLGTVIVQPQWASTPFSINKMQILRSLVRKGWHVITLMPQPALATTTEQEAQQKLLTDYLTFTAQRMAELKQLPELQVGFTLVVAEHDMAAIMLALYAQNLSPAPSGLILLNARSNTPAINKKMARDLTALSIPVLDVYQQNGPLHLDHSSELRAQRAKASGKYNYRQLALTSIFFNEQLGLEINGWTHHLGWQ